MICNASDPALSTLWIKICGITRPEDARAAAQAGADALGVVFHAPSRRAVDVARLPEIMADVPESVQRVALFVDPPRELVERVCATGCIDWLQFHGEEDAAFCASFERPYLKALSMRQGIDVERLAREHEAAELLLLDAFDEKEPGGTGKTFDWSRTRSLPDSIRGKLVLAGGLTPVNVATAVAEVDPFGVDVSTGVERSPGIKDADKIKMFIKGARNG